MQFKINCILQSLVEAFCVAQEPLEKVVLFAWALTPLLLTDTSVGVMKFLATAIKVSADQQ